MNANPSLAARVADWKALLMLSSRGVHIKQPGDLALRKELSIVAA